jgi:hypothetical protein
MTLGGSRREAQIMATAAVRSASKEADEQGIAEQDMFAGVLSVLAALTRLRCPRGWGAAAAPCGPVLGNRGAAAAAAGSAPPGAGASSSGVTTVAAAAAETPSRWARAARERAGAAPRARRAARSPGRRTCIHWLAGPCPLPPQRPGPPWRAEVLR